jgi:hypothetical protein
MRGLVLAVALLIAGTAEAGASAIIGAGASPCGAWIENRRDLTPGRLGHQKSSQDKTWVPGCLSGIGFVNQNGDDLLTGLTPTASSPGSTSTANHTPQESRGCRLGILLRSPPPVTIAMSERAPWTAVREMDKLMSEPPGIAWTETDDPRIARHPGSRLPKMVEAKTHDICGIFFPGLRGQTRHQPPAVDRHLPAIAWPIIS